MADTVSAVMGLVGRVRQVDKDGNEKFFYIQIPKFVMETSYDEHSFSDGIALYTKTFAAETVLRLLMGDDGVAYTVYHDPPEGYFPPPPEQMSLEF